jgi:hypothetical protein
MAHEGLEIEHSLLALALNEAQLLPLLLRRFSSAERAPSIQWVGAPGGPKAQLDFLVRR